MSDRLDPQFRDKLGNLEVPYDPADWASLQARLDAPARRRRKLLWLGMPAAAMLLGASAFFLWPTLWPDHPGESAPQAAGQHALEATEGKGAHEAHTGELPSGGAASSEGATEEASLTGETPAFSNSDKNKTQASANNQVSASSKASSKNQASASSKGSSNNQASANSKASFEARSLTNNYPVDGHTGTNRSNESSGQRQQSDLSLNRGQASAPELASEVEPARQKFFPQPLDPMAAVTDPTVPADREWQKDPTLERGRRLVDVALMGSVGLNAEYTAAGDGFRPGQDAGVGAELWFRSGVFLSAGLFYGQYHFHQNKVACGNPFNYGIKEPVHCPDALLGTQGRWEVPVQVGYGWNLARVRGRFRVAAGLTAQRVRQEDYDVEFHNAQPGVLLFYEPVTIAVTESAAENLSFDAYGLVESTNEYTVQNVGPSERVLNTKINAAAELALGYEQFLAPSFSLGVEPRIGVPFNKLSITEGRAYYGGVSARLRWYPGLNGR